MAEVKLNLIKGEGQPEYPRKPGDAIIIDCGSHISLVWRCPRCGQVTTSARGHKHVYDPNTQSLSPSIVHTKELGGCGYHGHLKNGVFKEC